MAEPMDPQELAVVAAQDTYNAAAAAIEDLLDDFPNPTWDSTKMDTWLIDAVTHWSTCEENWSMAGIASKEWYKLEYSLIARVPDLPMDKVAFACMEFNELVEQVLDYNLNVVPLPVHRATSKHSKTMSSQPLQDAVAPSSRTTTPVPLPSSAKPTIPMPPPLKPTTLLPQLEKTPAPRKQQSVQLAMAPQKKVTPTPITSQVVQPSVDALLHQAASTQPVDLPKTMPPPGSSGTFQKDWSLPLHHKPGQQFKIGPPKDTMHSEAPTRASSRAFAIDAAAHPNIIRGPDPNLDSLQEGNVLVPSTDSEPLFLPGTDNEEEQAQEDLVETGRVDEEVAGTDGEEGAQSSDEATSPPPTNMACRLCQEPRISFVFNEATGDFVESHPTIFLPRPALPTSQSQAPRRSARSHTSPTNPTAAYFKAIQSSKPDTKKKRKDVKSKGKISEVAMARKRARTEDDASQTVDKPAVKKLKLKGHHVDDVEVVRATPVVRRCGPGLSKPPPVTLGVSRGGFGEKVPLAAKAVENGIKSIGVLKVDQDFSKFMEVDQSYWSKAVTPFVGERYTTACDHCRRLGTQCQKLLTHTVKCVHCHYSKLPCKGSDAVNTFEAAVNAIEANNTAIAVLTQQYLAGLNVIAHTDSIHAQTFQLRGCLAAIEENEDDHDSKDEEYKAPDDVAEGESGPSKKQKHRSG
ncbi:hypothetical protein ARMGADRAFT_1093130 [Armillaria gallica]|uniref:Uncharacterized protein n=1 Tax=Armillaria gallica TaxID=47427 RepID=A0A2H3CDL5_ARMGA|nr:hypothetical protein ARMGADRAFT_1093130 [Armillaria gallica]